jgi:hypothetical protein
MAKNVETTEVQLEPARRRLEHAVADLPAHVLAGVKAHRRWQDDSLVTDAELQAAVAEVLSIRIG